MVAKDFQANMERMGQQVSIKMELLKVTRDLGQKQVSEIGSTLVLRSNKYGRKYERN